MKEFLDTDVAPQKIAECLSLCGPLVEKLEKNEGDWVYNLEITTNRVDTMSVYGIAREASVILPQFGYKARLKSPIFPGIKSKKRLGIKIINNPKLCHRILAIKLGQVNLKPSPEWLQKRLKQVGQRPLNNVIDITNYVMWELGHPIHVFDYDTIKTKKIIVREAKKGEKLTTLDGIKYTLSGGEVIFDNGKGEIIDLPGIMGTKNTVVTPRTKNILLWIESIDAERIRKASIGLNIRSQAAILNEKQVDPELGLSAIYRAIELFEKITNGKPKSSLVDIYPSPFKSKKVETTKEFLDKRLGVNVSKEKMDKILNGLGFEAKWSRDKLTVRIPSYRSHDIKIPEDIVEEIARIYGYHNLPSEIMQGNIPEPMKDSPFSFEDTLKNILKGWGGIEVYTYSMVPEEFVEDGALKLKNPLGKDSAYMRDSLMNSLVDAALKNSGVKEPAHLFEMANIYIPKRGALPEEKMTLAGILMNFEYRQAKGIIEALLEELNISVKYNQVDSKYFLPSQSIQISTNGRTLGQFGVLEKNGYLYYEFSVEDLRAVSSSISSYKSLPKYPAQIEDITLELPSRTKVGKVVNEIMESSKLINNAELTDIYQDSYTFRVWYQDSKKTLTDSEVDVIRKNLLKKVAKKFGAVEKT